eukprot:751704-Hanusia_phi.AAC.2
MPDERTVEEEEVTCTMQRTREGRGRRRVTDRQTDRQTDRLADRQTDRELEPGIKGPQEWYGLRPVKEGRREEIVPASSSRSWSLTECSREIRLARNSCDC